MRLAKGCEKECEEPRQSVLSVERLQVRRGRRLVLQDVSLAVNRGELLGIIGPNGAGKSTLLAAMAGLLPAAGGSISLCGEPLAGWPRRRLAQRLALVGQATEWSFALTVREVVALGRYPHQPWWGGESPADRQAIEQALVWTDLTQLGGRPITSLSGGEAQRVLLAQALAQIWTPPGMPALPSALLLDEPTAHLDLGYQVSFFSLWRQIQARFPVAILVVLHDLNLAARYCDRVVLLSGGQVVGEGTASEVFQQQRLEEVYGTPLSVHYLPADPAVPVVLPAALPAYPRATPVQTGAGSCPPGSG